ncbi:MAG: hypothetical protein QOE96_2467 [Blastocatellia bacterium]|nr:hypothetical protein [Blastocatellia bacterium]
MKPGSIILKRDNLSFGTLRDWLCLTAVVGSAVAITVGAACSVPKWQLISTGEHPHTPTFLAVSFTNPDHGWGLTPTTLFETSDGGRTWASRVEDSDTKRTFFSLEFVNELTGFIVGAQRSGNDRALLILRTSDAGKTWQDTIIKVGSNTPNAGLLLHAISFCDPQVGWAVGSNVIVRTTNGGQTWETQRSNNEEVLFGVACLSPDRAWVVGQNGLVLYTTDGGKTWARQASGTTDNLTRVRALGDNLWIVGGMSERGILLRTHNAGANWQSQPLDISEALFDIYVSGTRGWIVGAKGAILRTNDGGQTWERQESPTENNLMCLFFVSPDRGWAGGDRMTLLRFSE